MTIGELARTFGLSRGTLLHYDAIGLLSPSFRKDTRYRVYSDVEVERLRRICLYRAAGVSLDGIRELLDSESRGGYATVLRERLARLNEERAVLERQQRLIVRLLASHETPKENDMLNKEQWVALMRATGLNDDDMHRWHQEFEKMSGAAHEEFLVSLGIGADEVAKIREWSRS